MQGNKKRIHRHKKTERIKYTENNNKALCHSSKIDIANMLLENEKGVFNKMIKKSHRNWCIAQQPKSEPSHTSCC